MTRSEKTRPITYRVEAFGCPTSQYEGEVLKALLEREGFRPTNGRLADVYVLNTCVVTSAAARKARNLARRVKRESPETWVALVGCYPQAYPEEVTAKLPEVDIIMGMDDRTRLPSVIRERFQSGAQAQWNLVKAPQPSEPLENWDVDLQYSRVRPVLKVQEGCDRACNYCIVTRARGQARSLAPNVALSQAGRYLEAGAREIVLAGTHIGLYGKEYKGWDLPRLVRELNSLPYSFRLRLGYVEPASVTPKLIEAMHECDKVCPYLYIPLQSGSDRMLQFMGRDYSVFEAESAVLRAQNMIPDLNIYTDVITGFPGETEEDHCRTLELLKRLRVGGIHVFPYSPRPGTPAHRFDDNVAPDVKKRRAEEIQALQRALALNFHQGLLGSLVRVLPERESHGEVQGYSDNYVWISTSPSPATGQGQGRFIGVEAREAHVWGVLGDVACPEPDWD